jgi:hypothetical protein
VTWQPSDVIVHADAPVRAVAADVEGYGESVVRVRVRALAPEDAAYWSEHPPRTPGHLLAVDLPDPAGLDFSARDPGVRERYAEARAVAQREWAELRVVFAESSSDEAIYRRFAFPDPALALGVLTGAGRCVVALRDQHHGAGTGRVIELGVPQGLARGVLWLVPSVLYALKLAFYTHGAPVIGSGARESFALPGAIDAELDGHACRLEVLEVRDGYWPSPPLEPLDARCEAFAASWGRWFPGSRCPIGWLQELMKRRELDPLAVPDPPFAMTGRQRGAFAELWRATWPEPASRRQFADLPGWDRAVGVAEALVVAGAGAWSLELAPLLRFNRARWCENTDLAVLLAAAAIYQAALAEGCEPGEVSVCAAARMLDGEDRAALLDGLPIDAVAARAWRDGPADGSPLHLARLRAQHTFTAPHPPADHTPNACASLRGLVEASRSQSAGWAYSELERLHTYSPDGVGYVTCARCGADGAWLLARPARAWWWAWVLCRCGEVRVVELGQDPAARGMPFDALVDGDLEPVARERGFGHLDAWTGPEAQYLTDIAPVLEGELPTLSMGGDRRWRAAVREAAGMLAGIGDHPAIPRDADGSIDTAVLCPAVTLAALTLSVLGEATGRPIKSVDLRRALASGSGALHAGLAAALPDAAGLAQSAVSAPWVERVRRWPEPVARRESASMQADAASAGWAALAGPHDQRSGSEQLRLRPSASAPAYQRAFATLAALLEPP